ncbi:TPA: GTP cyclohydrolase II [Candidatus Daviesbacteria bacterium]|uniref:GTP cyclohydrolase-2 n=1 Tax=Candidatus Daviesbacteria bacterium GW2011_GWF2_38_6 TaxID=1618432 RepID=A0A0G0NP85_9BACT|nr:MAG: GTP cyclohydrolase-2 [Candidatus Daviesbacteria bacterium GW2011_GWF2_38_6]OGE27286.1 MAG: GTP cyclohydrolase II [Candidatus Daviesbacteria bacterium RIFCSPHIGHO2_01_FULL_38_8b]OGE73168.1 MAG: GTP cyclohydrolase II [Candidatus Daviesbacteria bacterium RIFCSPLOWO2_12_FULL_38_10]HBQ50854.1 GTP cyclohydrolase II [Candidatus Daviesbacteria bacterium]HCB22636.1 GTP cyclohydrolase II [Candidatus Daviesbacteria bacterium]
MKPASANLPTKYGTFKILIHHSNAVLIMGDIKNHQPVLTRIHSRCLTGDSFYSLRCDCGDQLKESMKKIQKAGRGIIIYLNQEGRGVGLTNKIRAYKLQDQGMDTVDANLALGLPTDTRNFSMAAKILKELGVTKINLLTNNPQKQNQLKKYGIEISKRVPLEITPNKINRRYLQTKKEKLGHKLKLV